MAEISVRCHASRLWIDRGMPAVAVFLACHHPSHWNDGDTNLGEWLPRSLPLKGTYDGDGSLVLAPSAICQVTAESFAIDLIPCARKELQRYANGSGPWEAQPAPEQVRQLLSRAVRGSGLRIENEPDLFPFERALERRLYGEGPADAHSVAVLMRDAAARRRQEQRSAPDFRPELELGAAFIRQDVWDLIAARSGGNGCSGQVMTVDGLFGLNGTWCWDMLTRYRAAFGAPVPPEYGHLLHEYVIMQRHLSRQRLPWTPTAKTFAGFTLAYEETAALLARYAQLAAEDANRHRSEPEDVAG